jgi:hypothetical protein
MTKLDGTPTPTAIEYFCQVWGDLIYGTKEQLQFLGLGVGVSFPGEIGCARQKMTVIDLRGFATKIELSAYKGAGVFSASIPFPGRHRPDAKWFPFAQGVSRREQIWGDEFIGVAEALCSAGLLEMSQLPGQPGMGKFRVRIYPDGTCVPHKSLDKKARYQGAKQIERAPKSRYMVTVRISDEEEEKRRCADRLADYEWEKQMDALPRPVPLNVMRTTIPAYRVEGNVIYLPSAEHRVRHRTLSPLK